MQAQDRTDWRQRALCAESDPEIFFAEPTDNHGRGSEAQRICSRCPVQVECGLDALSRDERYGVWGGMSTKKRRQLRRRAAA
jgi:WhiB family redox-sensing transcriptional regulator